MLQKIKYALLRTKDKLWVKPLAISILSVGSVFLTKLLSWSQIELNVMQIDSDAVESLLNVIASSMLAVATFAVGSMVSAYASVSSSATPRAVKLVISDDGSQNALSVFIGAFIFSVISLIALKNNFYDPQGVMVLFFLTLFVLATVIYTFVRWVDRIARLGRIGNTVEKVENIVYESIKKRKYSPTFGAKRAVSMGLGTKIYASDTGHVQYIDFEALQEYAEENQMNICLNVMPGTFIHDKSVIAYIQLDNNKPPELNKDHKEIQNALTIGNERHFEDDPRFGLIALSEIASRALSPAVNDPGTAISILSKLVKIFILWAEPVDSEKVKPVKFDRVEIPVLSVEDMFEDAFFAISRDGAGSAEVMSRLIKVYNALEATKHSEMITVVKKFRERAVQRVKENITFEHDLDMVMRYVPENQPADMLGTDS